MNPNPLETYLPAENQPRDFALTRRLRRDAVFAVCQRLAVARVKGVVGVYDAAAVQTAVGELIALETEIALHHRSRTEGGK